MQEGGGQHQKETPPAGSKLLTWSELAKRVEEAKRGGEVTGVITDLTVGPDGCGGQDIYVGQGGASQEEALTYCGRQGSPDGIPEGL